MEDLNEILGYDLNPSMEFPILSTSNTNSTSNTRQSQHQFNLNSHSPMLAASSQPSSPNSSFSSNPHQPFFYPPPNPALFFHQQQQQWAAAAAAYHQQQLFFHQSQYFQPPYPDFSGRRRTSSGPQRPSSSHPYLDNRQHSYSQVASLNPRSLNHHRRSKSDALSKDDLLVKTSTKGARPNINRTESSPLPNSINNKKYPNVDHLDDLDDFSPPMPINNRIRTPSHSSNDSRSSKNSNNNSIRKDQQTNQSTPSNQSSSQPNLSSNNKPSPLSQQPPLILNENKVNNVNSKNEKSGLKSKLKRALSNSSNNNLNNVNAIDDSSIGRNTNVKLHQPKQSSNSASNQNQQSQQSSPQLPARTRTISESNKSKPVDSSQENANVEKPKKHSIFNSKFNVSTDNISISSAASSASVMLRKIGSVGKLARRSSFAGLTNLFNKDKERDRDSGGEEVDENGENKKGLGSKLKKKKRNKRKKEASLSVSHATAEVDRHSIIREEPENNNFNQDGLSPAAALVKQHQEQVAAAEARASINSNNNNVNHSGSETNIKNMNNNASLTGSTNNHINNYDKYNGNYNNDDESESIIYSDDDDDRIINGIRSVEINDNTKFDLSEATHRREHFVKGILKGMCDILIIVNKY